MWKKDGYIRKIEKSTNGAQLISFDIFDTTLFRTVSTPDKIFLRTGEYLHKLYPEYDLPSEVFAGMRATAEDLARKRAWETSQHEDVNLDEIYAEFRFDNQFRQRALDCELETEARHLYLNPCMEAFIRHCRELGKTLAMVSDTYFSKHQIIALLEACRFDVSLIDVFVISSESRVLKHDGKLFHRLLGTSKVMPEQVLHIGDNKIADIDGAEIAGIRAEYYGVIPRTELNPMSIEVKSFGSAEAIVSLRKLASSLIPQQYKTSEEITLFETGASVFGSVYTAFAEWIIDQCVWADIGVVLAFMREGELLAQILDRTIRYRGLALEVKTVYISRRTTEIVVLGTINADIIDEYIYRDRLTLSDLFSIFYLDIENSPFVNDAFCTIEQYKINGKFNTLKAFFSEPSTLAEINKRVDEQRELLIEYIQSLTDGKTAATVDIGFRGTMQACLTEIGANGKSGFLHLLMMGIPYNNKFLLKGIPIRGWLGYGDENRTTIERIYRRIQMPEAVTNADIGTTLRYTKKDGTIIPIFESVCIDDENKRKKQIIWHGIQCYQECWFTLLSKKPHLKNELVNDRQGVCGILSRILLMPTQEEASVLGAMYYDESILNSEKSTVIKKNDYRLYDMSGNPEYFIDACIYQAFQETVYWPEGVVATKEPSYFRGKYIKSLNSPAYRKAFQFLSDAGLVGKRIAIYGAGVAGRELVGILTDLGIEIDCIADNNPGLQGRSFCGITVLSPEESIGRTEAYVVTPLRFETEILDLLGNLTCGLRKKPQIILYR